MKLEHDNFKSGGRWKLLLPLLPVALLPLGAIGFSLRPALEYGSLSRTLESARDRAAEAQDLETFLARFGQAGPPTEQYTRTLDMLASKLPRGFESADFFERCLTAKRGTGVELGAIDVGATTDLRAMVGDLSIHECTVTLLGRARLEEIPRLLAGLHRRGQPIGVLQCKLDALESDSALFDFQLELAIYHLAPLEPDETQIEEL